MSAYRYWMRLSMGLCGVLALSMAWLSPSFAQGPQSQETVQLRVWWPDTLIPLDARDVLEGRFTDFEEVSEITLEVRRRVYVEDDFARQLNLTQRVAPGALPDLVLMRREDLVEAAQLGLIIPLETWLALPPDELPENQIALGSVNGKLYGYPYLLEFEHALYVEDLIPSEPDTFEEVLNGNISLLFPASPLEGQVISNYLLLQYVAAGGAFAKDNGSPTLDEEIVLELMTFYAQAREANLLTVCAIEGENCLLNYDTSRDYWTNIEDDEPILATIDSHLYLQRRDTRFVNFAPMPIPTLNGNPASLIDGWLWVLITPDPDRQQEARKFIEWLMLSDNLFQIAKAVDMLPNQVIALQMMEDDEEYVDLIQELMDGAIFISEEEQRGVAALALQNAFATVLQGADAQEATQIAIDSLSQP